jgi:ankyrin repeat protein
MASKDPLALEKAIHHKCENLSRAIINSPHCANTQNPYMQNHALADALYSFENTDISVSLLEEGASIDSVSLKQGCSALSLAIQKKHNEIAEFLLESGADVNSSAIADLKTTPLLAAIQAQNPSMVKKLLMKGADVNQIPKNGSARGPLAEAIYHSNIGNSRKEPVFDNALPILLMERGADINGGNSKNIYKPIVMAVKARNHSVICDLVERGVVVNLDSRDKTSRPPIDIAVEYERDPVAAEILLAAGAKLPEEGYALKCGAALQQVVDAYRNGYVCSLFSHERQ